MISIDKNKFLSIVKANRLREKEKTFQDCVSQFYMELGVSYGYQLAEVSQGVSLLFREKNFRIIELPLKDQELSAFYYNGDKCKKYIILNSSLSRINNNFALLHEAYHVLFRKKTSRQEAETYVLQYDLDDEEACANTFAGVILMPEEIFKILFDKMKGNLKSKMLSDNKCLEFYVIVQLMSYFKTTYMSVLIRCCELDLIAIEDNERIERLIDIGSEEYLLEACKTLGLDDNFLRATDRNDYLHFEENIRMRLDKAIEQGFLEEQDVDSVTQQLRSCYKNLVG